MTAWNNWGLLQWTVVQLVSWNMWECDLARKFKFKNLWPPLPVDTVEFGSAVEDRMSPMERDICCIVMAHSPSSGSYSQFSLGTQRCRGFAGSRWFSGSWFVLDGNSGSQMYSESFIPQENEFTQLGKELPSPSTHHLSTCLLGLFKLRVTMAVVSSPLEMNEWMNGAIKMNRAGLKMMLFGSDSIWRSHACDTQVRWPEKHRNIFVLCACVVVRCCVSKTDFWDLHPTGCCRKRVCLSLYVMGNVTKRTCSVISLVPGWAQA